MATFTKQELMSADEENRLNMMRQMGVANIDGPLPHSPCLRNKKTGVILPWVEILALQRDLVECCDEEGNTDPEAWQPKVVPTYKRNPELTTMANRQVFEPKKTYEHPIPETKQTDGVPEYEKLGAVPYSRIDELRKVLRDASE